MRNAIYKLTFVLFLLTGIANANDKEISSASLKFVPCEKIYVQPDQVAITNEGIFLQLNEEWVPTEAIQYDASGIFVTSISSEWSFRWTCPKCGYENGPFSRKCGNCGHKPRH